MTPEQAKAHVRQCEEIVAMTRNTANPMTMAQADAFIAKFNKANMEYAR